MRRVLLRQQGALFRSCWRLPESGPGSLWQIHREKIERSAAILSRMGRLSDHSPATIEASATDNDVHDSAVTAVSPVHDGCRVVTAHLADGGQMVLEAPIRDDIGGRIGATYRPYEAVDLGIVDAFLPQNPAIIDVGANIGNHAIYWALTRHATVMAFEPYDPARQLLDANIVRNSAGSTVAVRGEALGAARGRAAPEPRVGNLGATRMRTDPNGPVDIVALDSFRPDRCDLVKVDVEGGELAVLEGASGVLTRLRPLVWVEVLNAAEHAAVRSIMRGHGYHSHLMLSPTNALFLPRRRRVLQLATSPRAVQGYIRRAMGRATRWLRPVSTNS